jgi:hypothetical protein
VIGKNSLFHPGLTKKSQKVNFTLFTEPIDRIFLGNTDFLLSPWQKQFVSWG